MTGSSGVSSVAAGSPLPKWQLALAVGAPVALGLGYMYYKSSSSSSSGGKATSSSSSSSKPARGKSKAENGAGVPKDKQISIDGESSPSSKAEKTPLEQALALKNEGNKCFNSGKYDEAIARYNKAIEICPKDSVDDLAKLYQNRAAAYEKLKKYSAVKADCTKALELKPRYVKALLRRATAMEKTDELEAVLEDVTAASILEEFANQSTLLMADRILNQLGRKHAKELMATRVPIMPSANFIKTYISTFTKDPILTKLDDPAHDGTSFGKAKKAVKEHKYDDVIPFCNEELEKLGSEDSPLKMEVLLLRATFSVLLGQNEEALKDLKVVLESEHSTVDMKVNALVKRASIHMQLENPDKCLEDFQAAQKLDSECHDIYYHRAQVNLLLEQMDEAKADYKKALELNPTFGVVYVHKCYADYRYGLSKGDVQLIDEAMRDFQRGLEKFPECSECYILYAQMLCDSREFEKADEFYLKAIEKDPENATILVHRGMLHLQWNGNVPKAIELINKALELDDKCQFGYETLGTIEVQRGHLEEAIELFDKALALGRTAMEMAHLFSLRDAAKTQLKLTNRLGSPLMLDRMTLKY